MKATVKRDIYQDGVLIVSAGETFEYYPNSRDQFITTKQGNIHKLHVTEYQVDLPGQITGPRSDGLRAVVRCNIWEGKKLIVQVGTLFDYNPHTEQQTVRTIDGEMYYLDPSEYLFAGQPVVSPAPVKQGTDSIKRIIAEDGNAVFISDRYPEDNGFTFAEILMLERVHAAISCDFEKAWAIVCEIGGILSREDLQIYLNAIKED